MKLTPHNLGAVPKEYVESFGKGAATKALGALAGSRRLCVNLDVVPPGAQSAKYHAHTLQEEFFLILAGAGTLRTAGGDVPVKAGDFMAKPAGLGNPHTFVNTGHAPLEILDVSTVEAGDVAWYPDEDIYLLRGAGAAPGQDVGAGTVLRDGSAPAGWTSEPDDTAGSESETE